MNELHLLDILAARHGCFISDLNLSPILRRAAILDLCRMDENSYPLSQWQDTVRYLRTAFGRHSRVAALCICDDWPVWAAFQNRKVSTTASRPCLARICPAGTAGGAFLSLRKSKFPGLLCHLGIRLHGCARGAPHVRRHPAARHGGTRSSPALGELFCCLFPQPPQGAAPGPRTHNRGFPGQFCHLSPTGAGFSPGK